MKKPALRKNRFSKTQFDETNWTKSSKNIGEYIFRRISLDQSSKEIQNIRPRHQMSQLFISSKEINIYVNDYLHMMDARSNNNRSTSIDNTNKISSVKISQDQFLTHS
jgi:hypothetical protein